MDEKEFMLKRAKASENYRINKFYQAVKDGRIKIDEALKELSKIKPTLKFDESLVYYEQVIIKLMELKNGQGHTK